MTSMMMRGVRRGFVLLATGAIVTGAAAAQQPARLPPGAIVQPIPNNEGAELRRHLTTLADNPRSLEALIGAGRASIRAGDARAALAFFGRADQVSPRNARVKAGMASALAHMAQAQTALSLFAVAVSLGAPEAEIAGDRGLAFDLMGDQRRAQQDYSRSLRFREDPEVRRRLALSLAISGERDAALQLLDPLLRNHDRAAWRVQAFVLALTGDAAGATRTARGFMPPAAAQAMAPFLARLPSLSAAEKALAVHFGHFPTDGLARSAPAQTGASADPGAVALAMGGPPSAARERTVQPDTSASRRSPVMRNARTARERRSARQTSRAHPAATRSADDPDPEPAQLNTRWAGETAQSPAPQAQSGQTQLASTRQAQESSRAVPQEPSSAPTLSLPESRLDRPRASSPRLAEIAALVEALPDEPPSRPTAPPPAGAEPVRSARSGSTAQRPARPRAARPAHPSRHWVQIAGGADRATLPREFARLRALAPAELDDQAAWTAPQRATNRLLVGPFESAREAQAFVNRLGERNVAAFAWTSPAGQEIYRLLR